MEKKEREKEEAQAKLIHAIPQSQVRTRAEYYERKILEEGFSVYSHDEGGYGVMKELGVVPFHDLHFEDVPAYQRHYPNLCIALSGFMSERAARFQGGEMLDLTSTPRAVAAILQTKEDLLVREHHGMQSRPRLIKASFVDHYLTVSHDGKRITVNHRLSDPTEAKRQLWVSTRSGYLENVALERVLDFTAPSAASVEEETIPSGFFDLFVTVPNKENMTQHWQFDGGRLVALLPLSHQLQSEFAAGSSAVSSDRSLFSTSIGSDRDSAPLRLIVAGEH